MKKLVTFMLLQGLFFLGFNHVNAQQVVDTTLKNAILMVCNTCLDNNGNLLATARTATNLEIVVDTGSIVRMSKGLEGFTALKRFSFASYSSKIHKFDSFPPNLTTLDILGYFENITKIPDSLISLSFHVENAATLPKLPTTLETISVQTFHNRNLTRLPVLPPFVKLLIVSGCERLTYIPSLPNSITMLQLFGNTILDYLPSPLPSGLENLYLERTYIKCLPFLPNTLSELVTENLDCIPNMPTSARFFSVKIGGLYTSNPPICTKINTQCPYPAFIAGKVYLDSNNNGVQNANESNAKEMLIKSTNGNLITLTDTTGKYIFVGDSLKTYTFSPIFSNNYFKTVPLSRTITTTNAVAQRFDSLDFAIQSLGTFPDIALSLTSGDARPGFNSVSTLTYKNVGTTTLNGTITVTLDAKQTFVSADVMPTQNGNVLTWNYTNLLPFEFKNINVTLKTLVNAPLSSLAISTVNGTITGATDANLLNNSETTQVTVRGSYDPNDKQVNLTSIASASGMIQTTPLTYTIRFQNTGNAEAIRVEVVDTLTKKLDITSIEMLGASHPYDLKIVSDSGRVKDFTVVKWLFDGIYLPDSTSNEKGSHGFIKFRIKNDTRKMGASLDSIFNKAAIYFDFNKPIITNSAKTLFMPTVSTTELKDLGLSVFPNPTSGILTIHSIKKMEQELEIDLINTNGQVLRHQILRGQNPQINVQELAAGLYFLKVKTTEGIEVVKVLKH
jgi:hypothetical protein